MKIVFRVAAAFSLIAMGCTLGEPNGPSGPDTFITTPGIPNTPQLPADTSAHASGASGHAFIWSVAEGTREIPTPPDARELAAVDINDAGEVAGIIVAKTGLYDEAFVWSAARGFQRTGAVSAIRGGVIVTKINAAGTIVGYVSAYTGSYTPAV